MHRMKWVGYLTRHALFIKTFGYEEGATYPDFGCNFETFSNAHMLETRNAQPAAHARARRIRRPHRNVAALRLDS